MPVASTNEKVEAAVVASDFHAVFSPTLRAVSADAASRPAPSSTIRIDGERSPGSCARAGPASGR